MKELVGSQVGRYHVLNLIGEGAVAYVYRARQDGTDTEVALKTIKPKLVDSGDFVQRFRREVQLVQQLEHPNIIKVYESGQDGNWYYIAMQLMTGGNVGDKVKYVPLSFQDASLYLDQIAAGLDYAHQRNIIHRDLKLENVLLDENRNAALSDFGMGKGMDSMTLTESGIIMGTPGYMSPEQCRAQNIDFRSDIYSLGVMLFEMLTKELPFVSNSMFGVMSMHIKKVPPLVSSLRDRTPDEVDAIVRRAMAKSPDERFGSAGELAAAYKDAIRALQPNGRSSARLRAKDLMDSLTRKNQSGSTRTATGPLVSKTDTLPPTAQNAPTSKTPAVESVPNDAGSSRTLPPLFVVAALAVAVLIIGVVVVALLSSMGT